jgi:hypothetical protein
VCCSAPRPSPISQSPNCPTAQAELLLSEESQEAAAVTDLKLQLQDLQAQVQEASQALSLTQQRVETNLQRVAALKAEATALERLRQAEPAPAPMAMAPAPFTAAAAAAAAATVLPQPSASAASAAAAVVVGPAVGAGGGDDAPVATAAAAPTRRAISRRADRGLRSSMDAEPALKEFWYPVGFSSGLKTDTLVPFELFSEPWVLFRCAAACLSFCPPAWLPFPSTHACLNALLISVKKHCCCCCCWAFLFLLLSSAGILMGDQAAFVMSALTVRALCLWARWWMARYVWGTQQCCCAAHTG